MMDDTLLERAAKFSRPTLAQVTAIVEFIKKHPELVHRKNRDGLRCNNQNRKLWNELATIVNSLKGTKKPAKGWIRYWSVKRRSLLHKQKQINEGVIGEDQLTATERTILNLSCNNKSYKGRKKFIKQEKNDEDSVTDIDNVLKVKSRQKSLDRAERKDIDIMEKIADIMQQQAEALGQVAKTSVTNSEAMEKIAETRHIQAMAVDKAADNFVNIGTSLYDIKNAITSVDETLKGYYSVSVMQQRNNSIINTFD